jgi:5'-3' exonuclease
VVDEKGNFYLSGVEAAKKLNLAQTDVSKSYCRNMEVRGHLFRAAKVSEVKQTLGDQVQLLTDAQREATMKKLAERQRAYRKERAEALKKNKKKARRAMASVTGRKAPAKGKKKAHKTKKRTRTIEVSGKLEHLKRNTGVVFEGHEFTGGPAVLCLPGTSFRMERPTKDDFPAELRDAARWT